MLENFQRSANPAAGPQFASGASSAPADRALVAGWRDPLTVISLRGPGEDAAFSEAASELFGVTLPRRPCTTATHAAWRIVWAGPDEWFIIGPPGEADSAVSRLLAALVGKRHAVTDVSSGYTVLRLAGKPVRDVLAQGCPLDLHPRVFGKQASAGSLFFKATVWLWRGEQPESFEALVRRSFMGYVWLMLERSTRECGLMRS